MIHNSLLKYVIENDDEWISKRFNKKSTFFWRYLTMNPNIDVEYMLENNEMSWNWNWLDENPRLTYKNAVKAGKYRTNPWNFNRIIDLPVFDDNSDISDEKHIRPLNKYMELKRMPMKKVLELEKKKQDVYFYKILCENPNLTEDYVIRLHDEIFSMRNSGSCLKVETEKFVHKFPYINWDIGSIIKSSHTSWNTILSNQELESSYKDWIYKSGIPYSLFKKYRDEIIALKPRFFMSISIVISANINIDDEFLKDEFGSDDFINGNIWCFNYICSNYSLTWEHVKFLEKYITLNNTYTENVSANPVITWDIVKNNRDFPWNQKGISRNPNFGLEEIKGFEKLMGLKTPSWSNISMNLFNMHPYFVSDNYIKIVSKQLSSEFIKKCGEELSAIACHPCRMANWHEDMSGEMEDMFNMEIERWKIFDSSKPSDRIIRPLNRDASINIMSRVKNNVESENEHKTLPENISQTFNIVHINKRETRLTETGIKLPFVGVKTESNTLYANVFDRQNKLRKRTCVYNKINDFETSRKRLVDIVIDYYKIVHDIILTEKDIDMRFKITF